MDLYHLPLTSFGQLERFPRRKAVVWLAVFKCINVAVPGQFTVYGDSKVLGFCSFFQVLIRICSRLTGLV